MGYGRRAGDTQQRLEGFELNSAVFAKLPQLSAYRCDPAAYPAFEAFPPLFGCQNWGVGKNSRSRICTLV
jgi:hypothetical protein